MDRGNCMGPDQGSDRSRFHELTRRELEVLSLLTTGDSNRRLAHRLGIAERTVKAHLTSLMRKLGVESRVEAALLAQRSQKALSDLGATPEGPIGERGASCKSDAWRSESPTGKTGP
ncbi:response regulator transcription factor [Streptomyces sp. NPDC013187]|uniref:response regulator transcription factor n=1 Tax=Streptomyces sp. NPDC013187 TaxID=3364865 RepID=UPI0036781490